MDGARPGPRVDSDRGHGRAAGRGRPPAGPAGLIDEVRRPPAPSWVRAPGSRPHRGADRRGPSVPAPWMHGHIRRGLSIGGCLAAPLRRRPRGMRTAGAPPRRLDAVSPRPSGGAMTQTAPDNALGRIAEGDAPVLETLLAMNLDALERSGLDDETYLLVRLAALVAMDAAPVSYLITLGVAEEGGLTVEKAQAVLVAIAPIVGSARVTAAAGSILRGVLGAAALAEQVIPEQRTP